MKFWDIDLTTRDGAVGAAQLGGYAALAAAVLSAIGLVMMLELFRVGAIIPLVGIAAVGEIIVFAVAGFRLHAGTGLIVGALAFLLLLLEAMAKLASMSIGGLIINVILLIVLFNGLRGANALQRGRFDGEDAEEIFG